MKYLDADLLRKEIEFAKSVYDNPKRVVAGVADAFRQDGRAAMCDDILKKIDSLQQEQQEVDLEKVVMIDNLIMNLAAEGYNDGYKTRPFYEEVLRRFNAKNSK